MNTIEEILKRKNESIYETYIRILCNECKNKNNVDDLCEIRETINGTVRCINYKRCMENKCKGCKDECKCFNNK